MRPFDYFAADEPAKVFCDLGLSTEPNLPEHVRLLDVGGGTGFLAAHVCDTLHARGHSAHVTVVDRRDEEDELVGQARARGFHVLELDAIREELPPADLVIMRSMNHFQGLEDQLDLLRNVRQSLAAGGICISQISSGPPGLCRLRSSILNLLARAGSGAKAYAVLPVEEYSGLLAQAGFTDIRHVGDAPPLGMSLPRQWSYRHAEGEPGREDFLEQGAELIKAALAAGEILPADILNRPEGSYRLRVNYPVIVAGTDGAQLSG